MSRPDPRLLVPVTCLPFVPEGARVWGRTGGSYGLVVEHSDAYPFVLWQNTRLGSCYPTDLHLDLSAPAVRDGASERLDPLDFCFSVLAKRAGYTGHATDDFGWWAGEGFGGVSWSDEVGDHDPCELPDVVVDVKGLERPDTLRVVVAAALRQLQS